MPMESVTIKNRSTQPLRGVGAVDAAHALWLSAKGLLEEAPHGRLEDLTALLELLVEWQLRSHGAEEHAQLACFLAACAVRLVVRDVVDCIGRPGALEEAAAAARPANAALLSLEVGYNSAYAPLSPQDFAAELSRAERVWLVDGAPLNLCSAAYTACLCDSGCARLAAPVAAAAVARSLLGPVFEVAVAAPPDPEGAALALAWAAGATRCAVDELEAVRRSWIARAFATPEAWRRGEGDALARLRSWDPDRAGEAVAACATRFAEVFASQGPLTDTVLVGTLDYFFSQLHGLDFAELFFADDLVPARLAAALDGHARTSVADAPPLVVRFRGAWHLCGARVTRYATGVDAVVAWLRGVSGASVLGCNVAGTVEAALGRI